MNKLIIFLLSTIVFSNWSCKDGFNRIGLYKSYVTIEIPKHWTKYQNDYEKYKSKNVVYEIKVSDSLSKDAIEVKIYDSTHIYDTIVTPSMIENFKQVQLLSKSSRTKFTDVGVKKVNNIEVGYLIYSFEDSDNKMYDGVRLFFNSPIKKFFEIEIYKIKNKEGENNNVLDKIAQSLELNF